MKEMASRALYSQARLRIKRGTRMFRVGRGGRNLGVHEFNDHAVARTIFDRSHSRHIAFVEDGPQKGLYLISEG